MNKCKCYHTQKNKNYVYGSIVESYTGRSWGTHERDVIPQ